MTLLPLNNTKNYAVAVLAITSLLMACSNLSAQQDSQGQLLQIGDVIEFDFLGKTTQGEIIDFNRSDWPMVEIEFMNRTMKRPFPGSRVTLIKSKKKKRGRKEKPTDDFNDLELTPADRVIAPETAEVRLWLDSSGKHKVKAKLLAIEDGEAKLEKGDGRKISLPIAKLSEKDQEYILSLEKAAMDADEGNPFAGGVMEEEENPFSGGERVRSKSARSSRASPKRSPNANAVSRRSNSVKRFSPRLSNPILLSASGATVTPDPVPNPASASNRIYSYSTDLTSRKFHNDYQPCMSLDRSTMGVCISNPFADESEIVTIDLETGKSSQPAIIDAKKAELLAISNDGKTAVTLDDPHGRESAQIKFWDLSEGTAKLASAWETPRFSSRGKFAPQSAVLISDTRLLTIGRTVALWNIESAEAIYSVDKGTFGSQAALSPGRNQFAINTGDAIYIVGVQDGNAMGPIDTSNFKVTRMAFSDSGQLLAGLNGSTGEVWVWDLGSQELVRQFSSPESARGRLSELRWCGDRHLLVADKYLMDIELRTCVWQYNTSGGNLIDGQDGRFWFVSDSKITPIKLPHKNLDDETAIFDPEELLVLKPGAEVSIKLDTDFAPSKVREIRENLTETLDRINVSVVDSAQLQLIGTVKKLEKKTAEVSSFFGRINHFGRPETEKITYTPHIATLELVRDSTKLWSKTRRFDPNSVIQSKQGESTQQAADRLCKPNPSFFTTAQFPQYIAVLPSGKPLGESEITATGIR